MITTMGYVMLGNNSVTAAAVVDCLMFVCHLNVAVEFVQRPVIWRRKRET